MEDSYGLDYTEDEDGSVKPRPVFITVLCILTFVGVGLSVLYNLWTFAFLNTTGIRTMSHEIERYSAVSILASLAGNGLCLWGSLFMWQLKKAGYFIYLGGHVLTIAMKLSVDNFFYDYSPIGMMNIFIFTLIFPIAFLIMYGVNLKYMK